MARKISGAGLYRKFKAAIRERDQKLYGRCRICKVRPIECAYHILSTAFGNAIRWNPLACVGACNICNGLEVRFRQEYQEKHKEIFGLEYWTKLWDSRHSMVKLSKADKLAIIAGIA